MARKKKKAKGFKVSDSFVCYNKDNKLFLLSLAAHNSLEKCVKTTQTPSEKCEKGEYCPKVTGCCWDYTQKKKQKEEDKSAA